MNETDDLVKNIDICLKTRELGAAALLEVIRFAKGKELSEKELADMWLAKNTVNPSVCSLGWYDPPPGGFSVLVQDEDHPDRLDFPSLRVPEQWSSPEILWREDQAAFFYCSPVDRETGMIGDFSVTLYNGPDQKIKNHFKTCYKLGQEIAEYAKVGMTFGEIYDHAITLFGQCNVQNTAKRIFDNMSTNIGHTFPWSYEVMSPEETLILENGKWEDQRYMISKKRKYVEAGEPLVVTDNMIFTVEARLKSSLDKSIPTPTFHFLVVFRDGKKSIVNNFSEIFSAWGMDYLG